MASLENERGSAPGQAIVVERRERRGCLRRLFWPVLASSRLRNVGSCTRSLGLVSSSRLEERYVAGGLTSLTKVAIVEVEGMILESTVEHAIKQIRQARDDDLVKAVVLRIDSPGGTV